MRNHTLKLTCAMALIGVGITGCATREPPQELLVARQEVMQAVQDPAAAKAGAVQLADAQKSLASAEKALESREDVEIVKQEAYMATRKAQAARAQGAEATAREQVAAGEAERNRVLLEARTAEADANRAAAESNAAQADRLKSELEALKAQPTDRGMVLTLGDVLFDTAKATVKPGAVTELQRVAQFMRDNATMQVIVEGHTDSRGSDDYNKSLSDRRASSVRDELVRAGVDPANIRTVGLGESYPVASNDNSAGQQQNRRVEVVFSDENGRFPAGAERGMVGVRP